MSLFNIGDIVAIKSHAYFRDLDDIKIAGEPTNVLPLMVVMELFNETQTRYSEDTGVEIARKGDGRCKCVWFSLKSNTFSESWFDNGSLKLIKSKDNGIPIDKSFQTAGELRKTILSQYKYKDVLFATSKVELKKIKETKVYDKMANQISTHSSLLNFVCPPLQILDVQLPMGKSGGKFDPISDKPKRLHSTLLFKCRYYNASSDKWSEVLLPNECFEIIEDVERDLRKIDSDRKDKRYYVYDHSVEKSYSSDKHEPFSILEIDDITYTNGVYTLKTFDLIHQKWKILDIPLNGISDVIAKEEVYLEDRYPNFNFVKGNKAIESDKLLIELEAFLEKHEAMQRYIQISFVNASDKVENRVLKDYFIVLGSTRKAPNYLHGFCCKKREERSFNFNNIRGVRVLNLQY